MVIFQSSVNGSEVLRVSYHNYLSEMRQFFAVVLMLQFSAFLAAIIEILDVAALSEGESFDIIGGFKATWRAHAWEGAKTC